MDTIVTRTFPVSDEAFARDVAGAISTVAELAGTADELSAHLCQLLQDRYPNVRVQRQETIAQVWSPSENVWYVYRDGRWVESQQAV